MNIAPIFQKGKKEDSRNYRPASLTSVKVMENIFLGGIEKHLIDNAVIGHNQPSFMTGKSYLPKLTSFYYKVTHELFKGNLLMKSFWISVKFYSILLKKISSA